MASFVLMNKNTPVLAFEYDMARHEATRITRVENVAYAPMGMADRHGEVLKRELNYWWRHRAIPASRAQVARLLENLRLESTLVLVEKSFGLSLSDCYWVNDEDDPKAWADVNFFDNDFSDDLGFLTLGQDSAGSSPDAPDYASVNLSSPNSTLDGDLLKKWKIAGGKRVLLKAGVGALGALTVAGIACCPRSSTRPKRAGKPRNLVFAPLHSHSPSLQHPPSAKIPASASPCVPS